MLKFSESSMGNEADKKFTWVIKNISSLQNETICFDQYMIGDCKWRLSAYVIGNNSDWFMSLEVADYDSLPSEWKRNVRYRLSIVNQIQEERSLVRETQFWFDRTSHISCFIISDHTLTKIIAKDGEFLVNGELKIVVEIDVVEAIGKLDVSKESEEATQPLKKIKRNDDGAVSSDLLNQMTQQLNECVDVNGFLVLPSQVESVRRIFERHPDFASKFRPKNRHLKSTYMNVLIGLIETLCQSPQELTDDDLDEASGAVSYVANGGFKLDWLEKKLEEVKKKKKTVETGKARVQQMEEKLQKLNQECLDLKALLEKEALKWIGWRRSWMK